MPRLKPQTTIRREPFDRVWRVPDHLRGLACQACGHFFQDGESHGEVDLATGEVTCRTGLIRLDRSWTPPDLPLCRWGAS